MGHQAKVKVLRGQVRIAVKEILPEIIVAELQLEVEANLTAKLNDIKAQMNKTLSEMEERQKDNLSFLIRKATLPSQS